MEKEVFSGYKDSVDRLKEKVYARDYSFEEELKEISEMNINIVEHPEEDVAGFNELYSIVQSYRSRVSSILIDIQKEKSVWQEYKSEAKSIYRRAHDVILTTQEEVKNLRNKELQEAKVRESVVSLVYIMEYLDIILDNLEMLLYVFREKKEDLDSINTNLSRQQKIVESLIGLNYPVIARADNK